MADIFDRDLFLEELRSWLQTQTSVPVGLMEAPGNAEKPYAILYPLNLAQTWVGISAKTEATRETVQLTLVGESAVQALWCSSKMLHAIMDAGSTGYTNAMVFTDVEVTGRELTQGGSPSRGSEEIYSVPDIYTLTMVTS